MCRSDPQTLASVSLTRISTRRVRDRIFANLKGKSGAKRDDDATLHESLLVDLGVLNRSETPRSAECKRPRHSDCFERRRIPNHRDSAKPPASLSLREASHCLGGDSRSCKEVDIAASARDTVVDWRDFEVEVVEGLEVFAEAEVGKAARGGEAPRAAASRSARRCLPWRPGAA